MKQRIGGYNYYSTAKEAEVDLKRKDDIVAFEGGLGWYVYNTTEYRNNPRKRIFGF